MRAGAIPANRYPRKFLQVWSNYASYNVAKLMIEFSTSIPRERLRPGYGDGFYGAPLKTVGPLVCCQNCGYAYYGKAISPSAAKGKKRDYTYYRCLGTDAYRFGGERICNNLQVRTDLLDLAVWQEVRGLLENPHRMAEEYRRRLQPQALAKNRDLTGIESQLKKLRQGVTRIIDSYTEGLIDKREFEPRITRLRERIAKLEEQARELADQAKLQSELQLIIGRLEDFTLKVKDGLDQADWAGKRDVIRALVKRVEVEKDQVNIVFRVDQLPFESSPARGILQHCRRRSYSALWRPATVLPSGTFLIRFDHLRFEPQPNQLDHTAVSDPMAYASQQLVVLNGIEVALQVGIVDGLIAVLQMPTYLFQGIVRAAFGAKTVARILEVRLKDRFQNQNRGLLHHPISHTRYPQWPEFPVFLWNVDSPHSPRQVTMFFQFTFDLIEKRPFTFRTRFDVVYYDAVNSRRTLVGLHPRPCCLQHVASIDAVIQRIKPKLWLLLRLSIQLLSQLRNFLRQSGLHPGYRLFRSRIVIQAGLPHLTKVIVSSQAPSLHGCYPLPRYYEPVRLPNIAARVVIDSHPVLMTPLSGAGNSIPSSRCWVSQVPRLISTRALSPLTPEGSSSAYARCFPDDTRLRLIRQLGHLLGVTRPKRVRLRYGSRARLARLRTLHYWIRTLAWLPVKRATTGLGHFTQPDQPGLAWRTEEDEESHL
jgi:Recombinase zinc beta ribbon domain